MAQRILLVDDDESLRQMYALILGKGGYELTTANDGVQGVARIREGGWDLILLDLMMPNMDGLGVLRGLREEPPKRANGPIVVLSNVGYEKVAEEAKGNGAAGFLMKADLLPADLLREVERYLRAAGARTAAASVSARGGGGGEPPWKKGRPRAG